MLFEENNRSIKNTLQLLGEGYELQKFGLELKLSKSYRIFILVQNFGLACWKEDSAMNFGSNFRLCYHKSKRTGRSRPGIKFFFL